MQIFIKTSVLDKITYKSYPFGKPANPNTECYINETQIRILLSPKYFLNPKLVKIYRYAANEDTYFRRLEFIAFLKSKINKYLFTGKYNKQTLKQHIEQSKLHKNNSRTYSNINTRLSFGDVYIGDL